jgi:hypothetical protein
MDRRELLEMMKSSSLDHYTRIEDILDAILEIYRKRDVGLMREFSTAYFHSELRSLNVPKPFAPTLIMESLDRYCCMADVYRNSGDADIGIQFGLKNYTAYPAGKVRQFFRDSINYTPVVPWHN